MTNRSRYKTLAAACLLGLAFALVGCDSSQGPDQKVESKRLSSAQDMRSYFNKVNGNYDALSATDKEAFVKIAGGEEQANQMWNAMKFGPGGRPSRPSK